MQGNYETVCRSVMKDNRTTSVVLARNDKGEVLGLWYDNFDLFQSKEWNKMKLGPCLKLFSKIILLFFCSIKTKK